MQFDFQNSEGQTLSGRLELPTGIPRAFALFAHCFTCSKDIIAASVVAKQLTEHGIGVLRFDFTGLGNSDGDFANTNFSSNVEDLISACNALKEKYQAPELLIGHSLGGAAVLKASLEMPEIKAVATIGAPSSVNHVAHLFEKDVPKINDQGQAQVHLAGRKFTIKKQFIDDINQAEILSGIKDFKKALLVMHSPIDNSVSIDHASEIFISAKHPKSFVSLDSADHLLMKRRDAEYAADTIGSWASRYISPCNSLQEKVSVKKGEVVVLNRKGAKFTQDIISKNHHLVADEPRSVKGDDLGMNPYELLLSSLGACTSMTMKMYCERKGIELDEVEVKLSHQKIHANDCEDCETEKGMVDEIEKHIKISGDFSEEQRQRILEIAEKCPVNRTLQSEIKVRSFHD